MNLESYPWWSYLEAGQQEGLKTAFALLAREQTLRAGGPQGKQAPFIIHDFSFIVFPAAKAYEGFLKKLFLDLGFLTQRDYEGDRFRIGRALNPSLEAEWRHESIYDKLIDYCQGRELPDKLWETWKKSRNAIFHWWPFVAGAPKSGAGAPQGKPARTNVITIPEAEDRLNMIVDTINSAFTECKIK